MYTQKNLDRIFFEVDLEPIFIENNLFVKKDEHQTEQYLFSNDLRNQIYKPVEKYKALIRVDTGHVFTIVTNNYKVITYQEAYEFGKKCFAIVFNTVTWDDMELFNITTTQTCSVCHIDIVHKSKKQDIFAGDTWFPFIRITNSYNKTKALQFSYGFARGICKNGIIFNTKAIEIKLYHSKGVDIEASVFNVDYSEIQKLEEEFIAQLYRLKKYYVDRRYVFALTCKALGIKIPSGDATSKQINAFIETQNDIDKLCEKYFDELGANAYMAFNVITDFASNPSSSRAYYMDSMQRKSHEWIEGFATEIKNDNFTFEKYLGEYKDLIAS